MARKYSHIDINSEKMNRIINCGFEVFSKNDFEKASTNNIVKLASVSRGLLYHFFKDKQDLFDFLVYVSIKISTDAMNEGLDWEDSDLLNRMKDLMRIRYGIYEKYPYVIDFFTKHANRLDRKKIKTKFEEIDPGSRERFYTHNIDFSKVKPDIDKEYMINVLRWTIRSMYQEEVERAKSAHETLDYNKIIQKCDTYIDFLREQFYI
jgi:TetR/AcrR family transcriptional regulator